MNEEKLKKHIKNFVLNLKQKNPAYIEELIARNKIAKYYQSITQNELLSFNKEKIYEYLSQLWGMMLWGNKHYVIDKIIEDNGFDNLKNKLSNLIWGNDPVEQRWDDFKKKIKGIGPALMSELLIKTFPKKYMLWNRRAYVGLNYLEVDNLPKYNYKFDGKTYRRLCDISSFIAQKLQNEGIKDVDHLLVDLFIWKELQIENNLSTIFNKDKNNNNFISQPGIKTTDILPFHHDDIKYMLQDIGQWLGFTAHTEKKVSEGSVVDTVWEATIGNMGRVIYVFEVQSKGSIDSLILNLLKALNNPAVQGVVAVSDSQQIDKIKKHVNDVRELKDKLKYWNYKEVIKVHESLEFVNESINNLSLVPEGF